MSGPVGNNPYRASGVVAAAGGGGAIEWDTSIHTSTVTAESGKGYFVNTTGGAVTVNLPAASVGDIVAIKDYAGTFDSNACTVAPNGSENIGGGSANDPTLIVEGESVTLVYADATQGWLATQQGVTASPSGAETFVTATGGNAILTVGDFKTHVFTGPGTFTVCSISSETPANNVVDYMVVAGGGGGAPANSAGGGAGGFRLSNSTGCLPAPTMSPLIAPAALPVTATGYPITVGGGGVSPPTASVANGVNGSDSVFSTITSNGGGGGKGPPAMGAGLPGASGGGARGGPTSTSGYAGGAATPTTSPAQGTAGGAGFDGVALSTNSGGGGGAGAAGGNSAHFCGGDGGVGSFVSDTYFGPTAPSYGDSGPVSDTRYFSGGGGGGCSLAANNGLGGAGGGGCGRGTPQATAQINTGGGGGGTPGGTSCCTSTEGGDAGSGVVTIRYKYQ